MAFSSDIYSRLEIVELLERFVVQRVQTVPGVGSVQIDGPRFAMRMWVDTNRLAAYGLTVSDVENALRRQNLEAPSGRIESATREFPIRLLGNLTETGEFENIVLATRGNAQIKWAGNTSASGRVARKPISRAASPSASRFCVSRRPTCSSSSTA